jgi:hypothetical protein
VVASLTAHFGRVGGDAGSAKATEDRELVYIGVICWL